MARTDDQPAEETAETSVDREQGGAPRMLRKERLGARLTRYFGAEVSTEHADVLMLSCCLISGFIDSTVYNAYGTFVSMQTGNTIFVGLGASTQNPYKPYGWAKSLTSIACFILGSLFFSRFCRLLGPLRRSTFVSSFLLQSIFIFIPAAIIQASVIDGSVQVLGQRIDWKEEIPIALLSFQSAGGKQNIESERDPNSGGDECAL